MRQQITPGPLHTPSLPSFPLSFSIRWLEVQNLFTPPWGSLFVCFSPQILDQTLGIFLFVYFLIRCKLSFLPPSVPPSDTSSSKQFLFMTPPKDANNACVVSFLLLEKCVEGYIIYYILCGARSTQLFKLTTMYTIRKILS